MIGVYISIPYIWYMYKGGSRIVGVCSWCKQRQLQALSRTAGRSLSIITDLFFLFMSAPTLLNLYLCAKGTFLGARLGPNCHLLVWFMITTHFGLVSGLLWRSPGDQIWFQMSPGPNSRGRIGTSDNFNVLMTSSPEAVSLMKVFFSSSSLASR